ncbi:ribosome maturation factor RimP [Rhabdobacter roseus]|uniref:Ribosome maturation factor RimP n=1 Tax=Rhabdobacter roseus TaxID=1655419 RepID=A0A840TL11_9BACT|nr:ribosome maturation factor RimP [Rhabdobacter roseus]MBB5284221.1 ribosome maturation factor RimP [Rhabdobacter roseus]
MTLQEQIEVLLEPHLEEGRYFLVSLSLPASKINQKVKILLDSDEGITIEECARISRRLAAELEEKEIFQEAYTLEVSSPGLDQPLYLPRQFKKNVGRELKVILSTGETLVGKLEEVKEDSIVLQLPPPKKKAKVPADEINLRPEIERKNIAKAVVQVSFKE